MLPNVWQEAQEKVVADRPLYIQGKIDLREEPGSEEAPTTAKILAEKVTFLADAVQGSDQPVSLWVGERNTNDDHLGALKTILKRYPGNTQVNLGVITKESVTILKLGNGWQIFPSREFWKDAEQWQNGDAMRFKAESS